MFDNTDLLFSSNKHGTNLSGNEANASSVGANTVNGPFGSDTVSTKSAAPNAATKVLKVPALVAVVGISTTLPTVLFATSISGIITPSII